MEFVSIEDFKNVAWDINIRNGTVVEFGKKMIKLEWEQAAFTRKMGVLGWFTTTRVETTFKWRSL